MYRIQLLPRGLQFDARPGETLLEAAVRQEYALPHSCDNGVCEVCSTRLLAGACHLRNRGTEIRAGTADAERLLICLAEPHSDCTLEIHKILAPGELPVRRIACQVQQIEPLGPHIFRVRLLAPAGRKLEYHAGQYLALKIPDIEGTFFSIANAPGSRELELHIEVGRNGGNAGAVMKYLESNPTVRVELPFGKACVWKVPTGPVVLAAAGTGFAQIKSIAEYLLAQGYQDEIHLFWGTRTLSEMYLRDLPEQWQRQHANFHFIPIAADHGDADWQGHHEELCQAISKRHYDPANTHFFVSGSPGMVYTLYDCLSARGETPGHFHSDVLEYAPRS